MEQAAVRQAAPPAGPTGVEPLDRGRHEYSYLVKVSAPGQFRAIPAQVSPMYVPGVHASSEPQAFTITAPAGGSR